jgi:hypothetical protein
MAHGRKEIRDAVAQLLTDADTAAEERVFKSRSVPLGRLQLPALTVYTLEETVDPESAQTAPRDLRRNLALVIEGAVEGATADDDMDALALEVETALHADPTFGGLATDSLLESTTLDVKPEGEKLVGILSMVYAVVYHSSAPVEAEADDLDTVVVHTNLSDSVHEDDQAEDNIDLSEE